MYCFVVLENYILFKTLNLRFFFPLFTAFLNYFIDLIFMIRMFVCVCMFVFN